MADNYLENKMEEYRSGKLSGRHRKLSSPQIRHSPSYPELKVFVAAEKADLRKAIVTEFRNAGCKVAFCDTDLKASAAFAQHNGSRFYPASDEEMSNPGHFIQNAAKVWDGLDVVILYHPESQTITVGEYGSDYKCSITLTHSSPHSGREASPDDVARLCKFLADPANRFLDGATLSVSYSRQ